MIELPAEWHGNFPFFLLIVTNNGTTFNAIDLEEPQWRDKYEGNIMREPGQWYLSRKRDRGVVFAINVYEGEQPYYVLKHIGVIGGVEADEQGNPLPPVQHEIGAFGIGKKRLDGHTDRLWVLPNGLICGGDDLNYFADQALGKV